jgi:hypothetical protein
VLYRLAVSVALAETHGPAAVVIVAQNRNGNISASLAVRMPLLLMDSALADVLALEAVRVFLPDVFEHLRGGVDGLSSASATNTATEDLMDGDKQKAQTNIELAKTSPTSPRCFIR